MKKTNIVLIGFMGTGKSVTGRLLAKKLQYTFIDMDKAIELQYQRSIPEIFRLEGEQAFRYKETAIARKISQGQYQVISTGGGVAAKGEDMAYLRKTSIIISLMASPETIYQRTNNERRPLLAHRSPKERMDIICSRLAQRMPYYQEADLILNTDNSTPRTNAQKIAEFLNNIMR